MNWSADHIYSIESSDTIESAPLSPPSQTNTDIESDSESSAAVRQRERSSDRLSTISSGTENANHPQFDTLAQIMADKDDEIHRLKMELARALKQQNTVDMQTSSVAGSTDSRDDNGSDRSSTPSHERATVASDGRRKVKRYAFIKM